MRNVWIGIGSNVGDRQGFCRQAVDELKNSGEMQVEAVSSLYATAPLGGPPQRSFVNLVARVSTEAHARRLLELVKGIEKKMGRDAEEMRWGPRVIDLDILLIENETVAEPDYEVPHARLTERRFALVPLLELDPGAADPSGVPYATHLESAEGDVELLETF